MEDIKKTTEYSKFKTIKGNRPLNTANLKNLLSSILSRNLLKYYPVLVNEDYKIIDGQHRLEVAKRQKLEVYYRVLPGATLRDVQLLNANSRPWRIEDYVESYITLGKKDYELLKDFSRIYNLPLTVAGNLLSGRRMRARDLIRVMKLGDFKVTDYKSAVDIATKLKEVSKYATWQNVTRDRDFITAFMKLIESGNFEKFFQKLNNAPIRIMRQSSVKEYTRNLNDIYTYHVRQ